MNELEKQKQNCKNRYWRLNHLYTIRDVNGSAITFKMNEAQQDLYKNLHYFNVILKARQLGFSTFIMMYCLDSAIWNDNQKCGIIAHTKQDAEDIFNDKIRFAYNALPDWLKLQCPAKVETARKLEFLNGSSVTVGTSLRGGTLQKLHISEYGKIAARYPDKAKEIKSGALNTVHEGQQIFIESTAEGRQGEFFEICERAKKLKQEGLELTSLDPKFHFFPWYKNPSYVMRDEDLPKISISQEAIEYLNSVESITGVELSKNQRAWYAKKLEQQGDMMKREFPSTPEESFEQSLEGAYYAKQMEIVRRNKQITSVPHEPSLPVYTFWDLGGSSDSMAIWFFQHVGNEYRFINYHESNSQGWQYYANLLNSFGYAYRTHYFPHDGATRRVGIEIQTSKQMAEGLGISPIKIVPRTNSTVNDIQTKCRPVLPRCWFDKEKTAIGVAHLDSYRKKWDDKNGCWSDTEPAHNDDSHSADAFRTFACGYEGRREEISPIYDFGNMPMVADSLYNILEF